MARFYPALFVFLWSTGFIGAKFGLPYAEPLSFLLTRYVLVILLMTLAEWLLVRHGLKQRAPGFIWLWPAC